MPSIPLTADQIAEAVKGPIRGDTDVVATAMEKRWLDKVTGQLNEMLANPRFPFRSIETLATVFDDDSPFTLTRAILKRLPGVRRSTLQKNVWVKEDNWVWVIDEQGRKRIAKSNKGLYILEEGVPEGHI